jgi:hypothetical protein
MQLAPGQYEAEAVTATPSLTPTTKIPWYTPPILVTYSLYQSHTGFETKSVLPVLPEYSLDEAQAAIIATKKMAANFFNIYENPQPKILRMGIPLGGGTVKQL